MKLLNYKNIGNPSTETGLTLIELILTFSLVLIVFGSLVTLYNFSEYKQLSTDNRRISDLQTLERAILEYRSVNDTYPDIPYVVRTSNALPSGNMGPTVQANEGWIDDDLSEFIVKLPIDPSNEYPFIYYYVHDGFTYELNAVLELSAEQMQNDGGSDDSKYEIGSNLNLIP